MCRLLGYLGPALPLSSLILDPDHSLVVQSYAPKELEVALLNADGFGLGWYHPQKPTTAFTYRQTLPIWNDVNLAPLCRYITSSCLLAYVRSATAGQGVDTSNCQPFQADNLLFTHNGFIEKFRETLYRPLGQAMSDRAYQLVKGSTDSEHIWGLLLSTLAADPAAPLETALEQVLTQLMALAYDYDVRIAANILISDGKKLVGSRLTSHNGSPSLYWLQGDPRLPGGVVIASEPLFDGNWAACPDFSLFTIDNCDVQFRSLLHLYNPDQNPQTSPQA